jgi:hypothetical protein
MRRTTLTIDGRAYELATGTDNDGLKKAIEEAVSAGGRFVDVTVLGNTVVSVLASPGVPILLTSREIDIDDLSDDPNNQADALDIVEWEIADEF